MRKKLLYGIFLIFLLNLSLLFIFTNGNRQVNPLLTTNSDELLTSSTISASQPSDLELSIGDTTNHTISWTLIDGPLDFLGEYSFTTDTPGANPSGWTVSEPSNTHCDVIAENEGHRNVLEIYDGYVNGAPTAYNTFSSKTSGTIEFWARCSRNTDVGGFISIRQDATETGIWLFFYMGLIQYNNGTVYIPIMPYDANIWYHVRIQFDTSSDWHLWIDSISKDGGSGYPFKGSISYLSRFTASSGSTGDYGYYFWVDAIDYSWASDYYLNRNLDYLTNSVDYLGIYSFGTDPVGSNPSGWIVSEPLNTHCDVVAEKDGYNKVIEFWDNSISSFPVIYNTFSAQTAGTIEFWFQYQLAPSNPNWFVWSLRDGTITGPGFHIDETNQLFYGGDVGGWTNITTLSQDTWYHIRIAFDCNTNSSTIWVNGTLEGSNLLFDQNISQVTCLYFNTASDKTYNNFYAWVDAIDYSWAPGYYLNRDLDSTVDPIDYWGAYSFTGDTAGSNPSGWSVFEVLNSHCNVVEEMAAHRKVVEFYDNNPSGHTNMYNQFPSRTNGTVEFWVYGKKGISNWDMLDFHIIKDT
ncbi:MAG TPA: hypothetical protein VMV49_14765, partial [Candidatus Deferrimicrobium sp.]|nr:hypothetical protein [Candidatus Deferrimicrobium sp.]